MSERVATASTGSMPPLPPPLPENWTAMPPDEKCRHFITGWMSTEGKPFDSPEKAETYQCRAQRWIDVIALKEPDQVPSLVLTDGFVLENAGIKPADAFYHPEKAVTAALKFHKDFDYSYSVLGPVMSGKALDLLGYNLIRWPGSSLPTALSEDMQFQYVEDEYMRADEYDALIADPEAYLLRTYIPRICDGLKGLSMMPGIFNMIQAAGVSPMLIPFAAGPLRDALDTLISAADEAMAHMRHYLMAGMRIMGQFGAPDWFGGCVFAPFDMIGDTLRCMQGMMLDMYRRPEKVIAACEALVPISVQMAVQSVMMTRIPFVLMPLHKGADGFMSNEQFEKFYWPTFKAQILGMIEAGLIPMPFVEGGYNERLDIIAASDLPAGKTVWLFDRTDLPAAKDKLGGLACIGGNVPASLFSTGTPEMMDAHCKALIEKLAPGGGFFLAPGAVIDQARAENMRAFLASTKNYGVY